MHTNLPTRRSFVGGAGALAAASLLTGCASASHERLYGWTSPTSADAVAVPTVCGLCPEQCGLTALVKEGSLTGLRGDGGHPFSRGRLCAAGYAYGDATYASDRIAEPMKRTASGSWEPIGWDEAIGDIAAALDAAAGTAGAESIALLHDGRAIAAAYGKRLMHALGSPNVFATDRTGRETCANVLKRTIGASRYVPDAAHTAMILFVGQDPLGGTRPSLVATQAAAKENGGRLCRVSPYRSASDTLLDEWTPLAAGTELAFVLALCQVVVDEGRYDTSYLDASDEGFAAWKAELNEYRPAWAESLTGIPASDISRIALQLAEAAPAVSVVADGVSGRYANASATIRATALLNTLLGSWNREGGALVAPEATFADPGFNALPDLPAPSAARLGDADYPLVSEAGASTMLVRGIEDGTVKSLFLFGDGCLGDPSVRAAGDGRFSQLDTCVFVGSVKPADDAGIGYLLPEPTPLESRGFPSFASGSVAIASLRAQAVDPVCPDARTIDAIVSDLASACGIGERFACSCDDVVAARLASVGLEPEDFAHVAFVPLPTQASVLQAGSIAFASDEFERAGLGRTARWIEPAVSPSSDQREFRLLTDCQSATFVEELAQAERLQSISRECGLDRLWMNVSAARDLGIEDGDTVTISTAAAEASETCIVRTTPCMHPKAVMLPSPTSAFATSLAAEPGFGTTARDETLVFISKGGTR